MVKLLLTIPAINMDQISCNKLVMQEEALIKNEYINFAKHN